MSARNKELNANDVLLIWPDETKVIAKTTTAMIAVIKRNAGLFFNLSAAAAMEYPRPSRRAGALTNFALYPVSLRSEVSFIVTHVIAIAAVFLLIFRGEIRSDYKAHDDARNRLCRKRSLRWMKMTGRAPVWAFEPVPTIHLRSQGEL